MKKHFLFGMLALLLAGFGFGGISMAACSESDVASIGENCYASLREAIAHASSGDTIEMLKDDDVSFYYTYDVNNTDLLNTLKLEIDKSLTINGHGFTIFGQNDLSFDRFGEPVETACPDTKCTTPGKFHGIWLKGNGEIVLNDLNLSEFGGEYWVNKYIVPIKEDGGFSGKLKLKDVNISKFARAAIVINGGTFEIDNLHIIGGSKNKVEDYPNTDNMQQGIYVQNSASGSIINTTIDGMLFNRKSGDYNAYAIIVFHNGHVTIDGSTFNSEGIYSAGISVNMNGVATIKNSNIAVREEVFEVCGDGVMNVESGSYNGSKIRADVGKLEIRGGTFDKDPLDYLAEGYTVLEKDGKYVVETLKEAAEDSSNTNPVQIAEGTTITTGSNSPVALSGNADLDAYLSGSAESGDTVISSLDEADKAAIKDSGYDTVEVKGALSLDFGDTAEFSKPIAIRIKVSTTNGVKFKAKHKGGSFGFVGLTTNPAATCADGAVSNSSDQYNGADVNPVNLYGIIYSCSASTFVAYTEAKNTTTNTNGGGGGGSSYTPKPVVTNTGADANTGSNNAVSQDSQATSSTATESESETNTNNEVIISDAAKAAYGEEQLAAYQWAYENGITTINDADKARLGDPLTRAELAKMMSQYISSVLKKSPLKTDEPSYSDVKVEELGDLVDFITKAYQYQIMGINADGSALSEFNPFGIVSRGEFATVFSRVLYGDKYNKEGDDFYTNHLAALKEAGVLSVDTPTIQEVRGWVMLMMYRSAQEKSSVTEEASVSEEETAKVEEANTEENKEEVKDENKEESTEATTETGAVADTTTGAVAENATGDVQ